jgi:putative transposase
MKVNKSYKYKIYPNKEQRVLISKTFGCVRLYWNTLVEAFNSYDSETNPTPTYFTPKTIKEKFEFIKEVSAGALNQKERDFKATKSQFFNKKRKVTIGRPKFKSKHSRQSFRLSNQKFRIDGNKIRLERIGWVKFDNHRQIPFGAKLMSATVSKDSVGDLFVSVNFEYIKEIDTTWSKRPNVGIDMGLKDLAILSDGTVFSNPKFFNESQVELAKAQRHLSRKKKGSNRYNKQRIKVAKIHRKISRRREWYLHNITSYIANNYANIGIEDLNIQGMMKNRRLSKSFADTSIHSFITMLNYKVTERGNSVVKINRFYPSSKTCSSCGTKKELKLSDRVYNCNTCGLEIDRDLNASINIKKQSVGNNADFNQTWSECKTLHPLVGKRQIATKCLT